MRERAGAALRRVPAILGLAVVWVLLWGTFTPLTIVGGVLVAVVLTVLFPAPPVEDRLPLRPVALAGLLAYLVNDLVMSAVGVSWQVLRYGPRATGAIIAVPLLSRSDRVVTIMASAFTLSPGTAVLQIDLEREVWYVYALGPRDAAGIERARRQSLDLQRRVLAAFGTVDELARAQRHLLVAGEVRTR